MSGAKHTPGPWEIGTVTRGDEICTIYNVTRQPTSDGLGQGWVYIHYQRVINGEWHWPDEAEKMANAHLVAAAPELLEALTFVADVARFLPGFSPTALQQADNAIAKAKGEAA